MLKPSQFAIVLLVGVNVTGCASERGSLLPALAMPQEPQNPPTVADVAVTPILALDPNDYVDGGFEVVDAEGVPHGWTMRGSEFEVVSDEARTGNNSLRFISNDEDGICVATLVLPATGLTGRLIRVRAWVKALDVTVQAIPWVRADAGESAYSLALDFPGFGTIATWTEAIAEIEVPSAQTVSLGVALRGSGTAWFDDVFIEVIDLPSTEPITLSGAVLDADGMPVRYAEIALLRGSEIVQHIRTDDSGTFSFSTEPGRYGMSAFQPGSTTLVGSYTAFENYAADVTGLQVVLGTEDGVAVEGEVKGFFPADSYVEVIRYSDAEGDVFAVPVQSDGSFRALLPLGDRYRVRLLEPGQRSVDVERIGNVATGSLTASLAPAPEGVVEWIATNTVQLEFGRAGHGFDDMESLKTLVGNALIIGLGEALHGSREMFEMQHRLIEYLVANHGFTVVALEDGYTECLALNEYVQHGNGDVASLMSELHWVWNTEEVMALVEWMRIWNADPTHLNKVHLVGIDMQERGGAYAGVEAFLSSVAPDEATEWLEPISALGVGAGRPAVEALSPDSREKLIIGLTFLASQFDRNAHAWTSLTSPHDFASARHMLTVLQQATAAAMSGINGNQSARALRDSAMADNVAWIREVYPPATRIALWAHNYHVSTDNRTYGNVRSLGHHLRERYESDYVSLGMVFGQGSYSSLDINHNYNLEEIRLPPAPGYSLSAAFTRAGIALGVLDLRTLPDDDGPVALWFRSPQMARWSGYGYRNEATLAYAQVFPDLYDGIVYLARVSRSRALPFDFNRFP